MRSLLFSQGRLADPECVESLKRSLIRHGALGFIPQGFDVEAGGTEAQRLLAVPLVLGLLPREVFERPKQFVPIKPALRAHVRELGIEPDDALITILKRIADNLWDWLLNRRPAKRTIADLRALDTNSYRQMRERQNGRCAVCGVRFDGGEEETLDHIVPWLLLGDPPSGLNWRLLCHPCNRGKSAWLSCFQNPKALNWFTDVGNVLNGPDDELRYIVLATREQCQTPECAKGPMVSHLKVRTSNQRALPLLDHLQVLCEEHWSSREEGEQVAG